MILALLQFIIFLSLLIETAGHLWSFHRAYIGHYDTSRRFVASSSLDVVRPQHHLHLQRVAVHAVCGGQHPLVGDESAAAEIFPVHEESRHPGVGVRSRLLPPDYLWRGSCIPLFRKLPQYISIYFPGKPQSPDIDFIPSVNSGKSSILGDARLLSNIV